MAPRWIGFLVFMAIIMMLLGSVPTGTNLALNTTVGVTNSSVNRILSYTEAWQENPWGTLITPGAHTTFFSAMFDVLLQTELRDAIFPADSPWMMVWTILWAPIIATVVFGIILIFIAILQRVVS